ncbi:sulfotransferase 1C2-like [Oppia nitens]|uniref:sulfotransferase 1C2-like n=1 Tax=Oppia nitens TaxID=1686743 RepID=UPI0023DC191E|nr:sulfotransferase 1C2-like [Oppia nitens]
MLSNTYTLRGHRFMQLIPVANVEYALDYKPEDRDRIQVSYPRSGSNWIQYIIQLIVSDCQQLSGSQHGYYLFERTGRQLIDDQQENLDVTILTTHLPWKLLPNSPDSSRARYLLAIRNPKDVCVSHYEFMKAARYLPDQIQEFPVYFREYFLGGGQYQDFVGDYFGHVREYWSEFRNGMSDTDTAGADNHNKYTILIYEHMVDNPREAIKTIAKFLGNNYFDRLSMPMLSTTSAADDDDNGVDTSTTTTTTTTNSLSSVETLLDRIVRLSSIQAMKPNYSGDPRISRGVVGNWRRYLTKRESDLIDQKVTDEWQGTGLELLWEQEMKWHKITDH